MSSPRFDILSRVHLFPVRHHSPRASAVLAAFLESVRPAAVLIEAPEDAEELVPALCDPETRPPVAILGYRTDGVPASALWPFAAYSPEYVAAKWGYEHGARVSFIDIPIRVSLGSRRPARDRDDGDEEPPPSSADIETEEEELMAPPSSEGPLRVSLDVHEACAVARGYRTFEEFWEASFEAPKYDVASFRAALLAYADLVRAADRSVVHRARDAFMASRVLAAVESGLAPESIVVVVGAAHAAALAAGDIDPSLEDLLPEPTQTEQTLIPFSFPRLAEQLGYGAGNRAPQYYQRAHEAGCSFERATLEVLVEFTEHLRLRGFMASLADTIEAHRLAMSLAGLRGKAAPGLDELREATIATLCRGDATHVDGFLWPSVIGRHVGKVAGKVARTSLQEEFWREVDSRGLPRSDSLEDFVLKLHDPAAVEASIFLHRLGVAGVPYASYFGKDRTAKAARRPKAPVPDGDDDALTRVSEGWEAQWTPSTDIALIERIIYGNSLREVTARILSERLRGARSAGEAASVLLKAVLTAVPETIAAALPACDRLAAEDEDMRSLARAAALLSNLVSYGSSRRLSAEGDESIAALCVKTFDRALLRVIGACTGDDASAEGQKRALKTLHEVAQTQPIVDREAWFEVARRLSTDYVVSPSAAGYVTGLLYLAQVWTDEEIVAMVSQRLSDTLSPARAAAFLGGFFEVNATVLVKSRPAVAALDAFLVAIPADRFRDTLPVLRRAFGKLGATERRYLLENVISIRKLGDKARSVQTVLREKDKEKVKALTKDLSQAMDDMDDLLK